MESVGEFEYSTKDLIGHGAFAVVFKGRHKKNTSLTVAIKSITKKNLSKSQNLLGKEIKILQELTELHHENVVALLDCKETAHHVNLVMEYCNGGDLADYLHAKGTLSEDTIRLFLRQIAGAMRALNAKGIVHRDLKPQNILLCNAGNKSNPAPTDIKLKIADFGFARFLQDGVMAATLCGSPMYMAPEVIMSLQYDAKADLWSIGTIVFQCLTGKAPFQAQTPQALKQFYEKNARLAPKIPSGTSSELADLLYHMLKRNARDRLEFDDFFGHPFLKKGSKSCSPVPIPTARGRHRSPQPIPSQSPSSPVSIPGRYSYSSSPGSTCTGSPVRSPTMTTLTEQSEEKVASRQIYEKILIASATSKKGNDSPDDEHDYVVVPSNMPLDNSYDSSKSSGSGRSNRKRSSDVFGTMPGHNFAESPTSGSPRPTFLPVTTTSASKNTDSILSSRRQSVPIPVPSQKEAYLILTNKNSVTSHGSGSPTKQSPSSPSSVPKAFVPRSDPILMRRRSSSGSDGRRLSTTSADISSLTPPSVQFSIGTPPSVGRRRFSSTSSPVPGPRQGTNVQRCVTNATPPQCGSPHHKHSSVSPPLFNAQCISAATGLPTILGSPTKFASSYEKMHNDNEVVVSGACANAENHPPQIIMPFCTRAQTLPELCSCGGSNQNLVDREFLRKSGSAGRLSDQILGIQHQSNNPQNVMVPWSPGKQSHTCNQTSSIPRHGFGSAGGLFDSGNCCSVPPSGGPNVFPFGTSPPIKFIAPELPEETLLAKEHNETLARLNFVLTLVDCITELAKSKGAPIPALSESNCRNENTSCEGYKKAEQLVLYMRLLQMLSSSLKLAQEEIKAKRLQSSSSVRKVLGCLNDRFRFCLNMCKSLNTSNVLQSSGIDPNSSMLTADRLIYNYAIELCQTAALDELFGNPQECFKRYQTAQLLLHSLSQQIGNDQDKSLLTKYKEAVEKRLFVIQGQGYHIYAYDT